MPFCLTLIRQERMGSWFRVDTSETAITWEVMKSVRRWLRKPGRSSNYWESMNNIFDLSGFLLQKGTFLLKRCAPSLVCWKNWGRTLWQKQATLRWRWSSRVVILSCRPLKTTNT
jgi:hypothetical protein